MLAWKKIGCAVDGSPASLEALRTSAELARQCGAELVLVHVESDPGEGMLAPPLSRRQLPAGEQSRLEDWGDMASEFRGAPVRVELGLGPPASEIVSFSRREGCDLLVLGTRARHSATFAIGSVAAHVVPHAPCSVLLVH